MPLLNSIFKEIDWIVYLPSHGNEGSEYEKYGVAFRDRKRGRSKSDRRISLGELMRESVMKDNYPHTVGFFLASSGKGTG